MRIGNIKKFLILLLISFVVSNSLSITKNEAKILTINYENNLSSNASDNKLTFIFDEIKKNADLGFFELEIGEEYFYLIPSIEELGFVIKIKSTPKVAIINWEN